MERFQDEMLTRDGFDTEQKRALRKTVLQRIHGDSKAWTRCWRFTDAYGVDGFMPSQGYDWSGFRDSTYTAICKMADALRIAR